MVPSLVIPFALINQLFVDESVSPQVSEGVNLRDGDTVVGASVITNQDEVLIITEKDMVNVHLLPNILLKAVVVKG